MGVSHEGWDGFFVEEQDLGANHTTWRKEGFAKQVSLQSKDWAWWKQTIQGKTCCKRVSKKKMIDYFEIFSPVVKLTIIKVVLGIVGAENLHLEQLDVKIAFLHGDLGKDIYMQQPEGFAI